MPRPSARLSDPVVARVAWRRFRRMMAGVALFACLAVAAAIIWLRAGDTPFPLPMLIATIAGVFCTVMLAGALMLLAFLSSGSGHDEDAAATPSDARGR